MSAERGLPLEGLSVVLGDDDIATRASGWWLEHLGASVTSDRALGADIAVVRRHDGSRDPVVAATMTIAVTSPTCADDAVAEAARLWVRSGLASLTRTIGEEDGHHPPCLPTVSIVQGLGAMIVALIVSAYAARSHRDGERSAAPREIEIDLLELLCLLPSQFVAMAQVPSRSVAGVVGAVGWRIGGVIETSDGAVCAQAPEPGQWARLVEILPGGKAVVSDCTDPVQLRDHAAEVDLLLRAWAAPRTKHEVCDLAQAVRVPVTPLLRPDELPSNPHYAARAFFTSDDPRRTRLPWLTRAAQAQASDRQVSTQHPPARTGRPLAGFRILDLTWAWAGPFATMLLAELGAEIVNIEAIPRPSNLRVQQPLVDGFGFDASAWWSATQRGKSSVGINLKHEEGRRLVTELARRSTR